MASELGGLIIGGGLVLASSLFSASYNECKIDFAAKDEAIKIYNKLYEQTLTANKDVIVLAPCIGDSYSPLRYLFSSLGFDIVTKPGDQFVTVDFTRLIRAYPSFESERKLSAALFAAGLVLSPGEANGFEEPGFFRMFCSVYSSEQIEQIRQKLLKVIKTFKCSDPYAPKEKNADSAKRLASELTSKIEEPSEEEPAAPATASKAPKTVEKAAPKTAEKRRRVAADN